MTLDEVMRRLAALGRPGALPQMARYGIDTSHALGVAVPGLRRLARTLGRDHALALALWRSGVHDARLLATMVADPARIDEAAAERLARDFRSWDLCDQCCLNLYRHLPFAHALARAFAAHQAEFVRRAGFSLIAVLAVHDKQGGDAAFAGFLALIEAAADDPRPMVRKSVNWALRQIGKRSATLHAPALATAERIEAKGGAARRVGSDALRELRSPPVLARLAARAARPAEARPRQAPRAAAAAAPRDRTRHRPGSGHRPAGTPPPPRRG
jgi:3-methyladenine DNA glycosylase AlkD